MSEDFVFLQGMGIPHYTNRDNVYAQVRGDVTGCFSDTGEPAIRVDVFEQKTHSLLWTEGRRRCEVLRDVAPDLMSRQDKLNLAFVTLRKNVQEMLVEIWTQDCSEERLERLERLERQNKERSLINMICGL